MEKQAHAPYALDVPSELPRATLRGKLEQLLVDVGTFAERTADYL